MSHNARGKYSLVSADLKELSKLTNANDDWVGIHYHKGRIVMAFNTGLIVKCAVCYIFLQLYLAFVIYGLETTIIHSLSCTSICIALFFALYLLLWLWSWYNIRFNPIPLYRLPFLLIMAVLFLALGVANNWYNMRYYADIIMSHEFWLQSLQHSVDGLHDEMGILNDKLLDIEDRVNTSYNSLLKDNESTVNKMEKWVGQMWEGFGLITVTRHHFGLGCFLYNTSIAVSSNDSNYYDFKFNGNELYLKKIEELDENDFIYNPELNEFMKIKIITQGPENGNLYEFITNDNLSVTVTKTHPMLVCNEADNDNNDNNNNNNNTSGDDIDGIRMKCDNVAASKVSIGDLTKTIHGFQKVVKINKRAANNDMVYNIMLDMYPRNKTLNSVIKRGIIANGIFTLDLYAQGMNE